jgi:aryl-alcohol dehydrogenase-like predicted oxidoreductase
MDYTMLGRTGLRVSVAGLGCGGNSRLGLGAGKTEAECMALVRTAHDLGVNFFDTAEVYGTEELLGRALAPLARESFVISSKSRILDEAGNLLPASVILARLDESLRRLGVDHIDVYHLHAVPESHYDHALEVLAPALLKEKDKGKIRHLGITETPPRDPGQRMLSRALHDPCWEVVMLAFHMMNQGARTTVLPLTREHGIGTLLMFVVRNIFSRPGVLQETMRQLAAEGRVPPSLADDPEPLGFLIHAGGARSLTDAAYRFARHEPGVDVVLFGTGDAGHLRANVASLLAPPLPAGDVLRLRQLFGALQGVGLVLPDFARTTFR